MDFGTLKAAAEAGRYSDPQAVLADAALVFENAYKFNAIGSDVAAAAEALQVRSEFISSPIRRACAGRHGTGRLCCIIFAQGWGLHTSIAAQCAACLTCITTVSTTAWPAAFSMDVVPTHSPSATGHHCLQ
jgi:hypothetical protein